jgi:ferritin
MAKLSEMDVSSITKKVDKLTTKVDKIESKIEEIKIEETKEEISEVEEVKEVTDEKVKETSTDKKSCKNPFASDECIKMLNFRIEQEEQSSRIYEAMSLWLNDNGFKGAAKRWKQDSLDELKHAGWAKEFLLAMGCQPKLPALKEPVQEFEGLLDIVIQSYDHEIMVTEQCNDLAKYAIGYGNHLLYQLAIKYLTEQFEEIMVSQDRIDRLTMAGNDKIAILLIDQELGDF